MIKNRIKNSILSLTLIITLLAPAAPTLAYTQAYERNAGYDSYYQNPNIVNRNAGTTILPEYITGNPYSYYSYEYGGATYTNNSGPSLAESLIPRTIVDQYWQRNGRQPASDMAAASYTIKKGDTLYRISKLFGVSVDMLVLENQISDPTKLQIGQKIRIPANNQEAATWLERSSEVSDVFYATLTAYTAGYESTGKTPSHPAYGITASGAKVKENHTIAVDPNVIPLGTLVYIEGIGLRKAEDTGSAIKGKKIDVYIPDLEEALEFGVKKNVKVYVLGQAKKNDVHIASAKP